jgi:hypothetical protein
LQSHGANNDRSKRRRQRIAAGRRSDAWPAARPQASEGQGNNREVVGPGEPKVWPKWSHRLPSALLERADFLNYCQKGQRMSELEGCWGRWTCRGFSSCMVRVYAKSFGNW